MGSRASSPQSATYQTPTPPNDDKRAQGVGLSYPHSSHRRRGYHDNGGTLQIILSLYNTIRVRSFATPFATSSVAVLIFFFAAICRVGVFVAAVFHCGGCRRENRTNGKQAPPCELCFPGAGATKPDPEINWILASGFLVDPADGRKKKGGVVVVRVCF